MMRTRTTMRRMVRRFMGFTCPSSSFRNHALRQMAQVNCSVPSVRSASARALRSMT
jgi:hypothetical protein